MTVAARLVGLGSRRGCYFIGVNTVSRAKNDRVNPDGLQGEKRKTSAEEKCRLPLHRPQKAARTDVVGRGVVSELQYKKT